MRVPGRIRCPLSRGYTIAFLAAAACYAAVLAAVVTGSGLVRLDWQVALFKPYKQWPQARPVLDAFVIAGQRGPTALAALVWAGWRGRRTGSLRPPLVLGTALVLLNASVGAVKILTGRLNPQYAQTPGSAELLHGGMAFPSGHTANAVVVWGAVAYLAGHHRRTGALVACLMALGVGLTTVYLGTHWVSDVLGGWAAGALVLLTLPLLEPLIATVSASVSARAAVYSMGR
ncbi:phosphatase PAP2 family protein [Streptomyces luomodiensis]|uniref:phosphatase PAP2 family protein n=1 Tax=Streptomyces luomodiensis TaxID=3026192 RepID=UPI00287B8FCD|nr:phosphatase PAP2 family protein [Streptomyces sp. SCA4-21]